MKRLDFTIKYNEQEYEIECKCEETEFGVYAHNVMVNGFLIEDLNEEERFVNFVYRECSRNFKQYCEDMRKYG